MGLNHFEKSESIWASSPTVDMRLKALKISKKLSPTDLP